MPKKSDVLLVCVPLVLALTLACPLPEDDPPGAPDPIGDLLLSGQSLGGLEGCQKTYLYRDGQALQFQCFRRDDTFSWENRGTLTVPGAAALDEELAAADLDDMTPGDYMGLCAGADSQSSTMTLWIDDRSISYSMLCPTKGIEALNELLVTLFEDISECAELDLLESVEPGCRAY